MDGTEYQERGRSRSVYDALWGSLPRENSMNVHNPLPTRITGALTQEQLVAYQVMYRIQEITAKLRTNDMVPPPRRSRSPSPPPVYDTRGKRTNTREQRYRRKLEEERHRLVEIALKMIPHFVAPDDYKRPTKFQDKYYIPVDQYPEINFVGLLLGPRGNTLKKLQDQSGAKIAIRGRGSVKEGKNASDLPKGAMNFSEPLHCVITADSEDKIQKGIKACEGIIIKAVTSPEGQNDLKRGQLRELAELNGTLREDNRPCPICGLQGHKRFECPNRETFAQKIICRRCGQSGHATRDCNFSPEADHPTSAPNGELEFARMMQDLHAENPGIPVMPYQQRAMPPPSLLNENPNKRQNDDYARDYKNDWKRRNFGSPQMGSRYSNTNTDARYNDSLYHHETVPAVTSYRARYSRDTSSTSDSVPAKAEASMMPSGPPGFTSSIGTEVSDLGSASTMGAPPGSDFKNIVAPALPPGLSAPPGLTSAPGMIPPPGLNGPPGSTSAPGLNNDNKSTPTPPPSIGLNGPPGL